MSFSNRLQSENLYAPTAKSVFTRLLHVAQNPDMPWISVNGPNVPCGAFGWHLNLYRIASAHTNFGGFQQFYSLYHRKALPRSWHH